MASLPSQCTHSRVLTPYSGRERGESERGERRCRPRARRTVCGLGGFLGRESRGHRPFGRRRQVYTGGMDASSCSGVQGHRPRCSVLAAPRGEAFHADGPRSGSCRRLRRPLPSSPGGASAWSKLGRTAAGRDGSDGVASPGTLVLAGGSGGEERQRRAPPKLALGFTGGVLVVEALALVRWEGVFFSAAAALVRVAVDQAQMDFDSVNRADWVVDCCEMQVGGGRRRVEIGRVEGRAIHPQAQSRHHQTHT